MTESNQTEARLRDQLSERLHLLEPGLTLRSVEFRLPNRQGASGSIDILASDIYSATVIIELKKSNQTARQALHELHKYVALLKDAHGLRGSQIRCMLVSTEWHELLVPFSEFVRSSSWTVDGYRLALTDAGAPWHAEKIVPLAPSAELRLCPEHSIYLFREQARRDEAVSTLLKSVSDSSIRDCLLLKLDIKQRRFEGTCDFAIYLIVPEFTMDERQESRVRLTHTRWADDLDSEVEYLEEQLVLMEATGSLERDEFEIGYPEKLAQLCVTWDVTALIRSGRLMAKAVFSDDYLLRWAKGIEGRNAQYFEMIATPSRQLSWREAKQNAAYCLLGNTAWQDLVKAYFDEIERDYADASVSTRIYNPCNLMMGLYRLAKLNVGDLLPSAEIVVSNNNGSPARIVLGSLVWNGKLVNEVSEVLPDGIPTLFDLLFVAALDGGAWAAEEHLVAQHGLQYVLVECTDTCDGTILEQLVVRDGALQRLKENKLGLMDLGAFYAAHQNYLRTLIKEFDSCARFM